MQYNNHTHFLCTVTKTPVIRKTAKDKENCDVEVKYVGKFKKDIRFIVTFIGKTSSRAFASINVDDSLVIDGSINGVVTLESGEALVHIWADNFLPVDLRPFGARVKKKKKAAKKKRDPDAIPY